MCLSECFYREHTIVQLSHSFKTFGNPETATDTTVLNLAIFAEADGGQIHINVVTVP